MVFWEFVVCACFSVEDGQARIRVGWGNLGEECSNIGEKQGRKERKREVLIYWKGTIEMEGQLYDSNGDDRSCCRMNNNEVDENKEKNMKIRFGR